MVRRLGLARAAGRWPAGGATRVVGKPMGVWLGRAQSPEPPLGPCPAARAAPRAKPSRRITPQAHPQPPSDTPRAFQPTEPTPAGPCSSARADFPGPRPVAERPPRAVPSRPSRPQAPSDIPRAFQPTEPTPADRAHPPEPTSRGRAQSPSAPQGRAHPPEPTSQAHAQPPNHTPGPPPAAERHPARFPADRATPVGPCPPARVGPGAISAWPAWVWLGWAGGGGLGGGRMKSPTVLSAPRRTLDSARPPSATRP